MPDYLMNFSLYPNSPIEIRADGLFSEIFNSYLVRSSWHDIANEYEGVLVGIRQDGIVFNFTEATAARIRLAWATPLVVANHPKTTLILTLTPIIEPVAPQKKASDIAFLVSLESVGCLPDSQSPAFTFKDAIEEARSMFEQERLEDGTWAWAVESGLTRKEVIGAMPYGCVYASENREHGLYRVVITAVDKETAESWQDD